MFYSIKKSYLSLLGLLIATISLAQTPTRNGALDLTSDEGEQLIMNHDGSGEAIGVQGNQFTAETWVKVVANTDNDLQLFRLVNNNNFFCLVYRKDGEFYIETEGDVGDETWTIPIPTSTKFLNNWVHVAFVNNGANGKLYINGVLAIESDFVIRSTGNKIKSLFPQKNSTDLDGKCELGGTAKNSGTKGKGYFAEVRLFNIALSSSTIAKYYDEEINKSHPNWSNLKRYYHLSSQYTSSGTVYMKDITGNYDATVSDNTNNTIKDFYPPIKPAAFDNSTFGWSFTAADCQSNSIAVNWTSLRSSTIGYYTDKNVYFSLGRTDTNAVLYDGINHSFTDTTAFQGKKYYYTVRTYWLINGKKVYSDDEPTSDVGTIKMQYAAPTNVVSSGSCNNSIDISWKWTGANPPKWRISRATNSAFTSGLNFSTSIDGALRKYTNTNPGIETDFYYKVYAEGVDTNGCTVSGISSSVTKGFTSQPPAAPTSLVINKDTINKTAILTWANPNGNNAEVLFIKRTDEDGSNPVIKIVSNTTTNYTDTTIQICKTYYYSIASVNECAATGIYLTPVKISKSNIEIPAIISVTGLKKTDFANLATGGTAAASSYWASVIPQTAFDGDSIYSGWASDYTSKTLSAWLSYSFGNTTSKVVNAYAFYCSSQMSGGWGDVGYTPYQWTFEGFDGTKWVVLDERIDLNQKQDVWKYFYFSNTAAYQSYRLQFNNNKPFYAMITEMKMGYVDYAICKGSSINLATNEMNNLKWSTNEVSGLIKVSPNSTTTYSVSGFDEDGCGFINSIKINVNQPTTSTITEIVTGSYTMNNQTYTTSGVYNQTLTNKAGCDSTITLNLTVNILTSIDDSNENKVITISPNPFQNEINVLVNANDEGSVYQILDLQGKLLVNGNIDAQNVKINLSTLNAGIYIFKMQGLQNRIVKIVKE